MGSSKSERGSLLVEAAFITLLFLVLLFAIVEAGRLLSVQQSITNAAREGARLAVMPLRGTSTLPGAQEIEERIREFTEPLGIQPDSVSIERPVLIQTGNVVSEFTRVTVRVPYRVITVPLFDQLEMTLVGQALMRNETSP